ncbi:MAG: IS200/IS605 family element transposase accessory protein TnpB [Cenarchaeum sp. SB0665_bin_23]|nr:IS200/IS605 family element transposase accessory protein TnpB [Cenarchaeum sp. SB0667_bin_13]MXY37664.1 IS200/IS605 family element transposase accessory protein TnpB [Cenarchaeum sp. SB0664_bin_35]MXY61611.1 IS200/IS605 family element transposase accessory protein TnpB [Cenarchaeum sp. SB0665_bin_23]MXZ93865.1 IS200/IS605 family element transposase accessory protein TnpB [Cenarchaeum sp. SB0666_bin_15]MYB46848.1 IS200/IS605 family element transposase accessory protein TnpB [Cenarchaeum sp. S
MRYAVSCKIVDVTNHGDKERQFELHVTIREHVPDRVCTGIHAGIDMGGKHTLIVGKSDGSIAMLTLREKDTLRNIARIQKKMARCKLHSHKWRNLHAQLQSVYKKMENKQKDKLRKFAKKLFAQCDKIIMEGMNLRTMTTKGKGQKNKNRPMRQSKCGEARALLTQQALQHNTEYMEIDQKYTSQHCCMCGSTNTWRKGSKFRCHNCGVAYHADVNAAFNILFTFYAVQWSKRAQAVYTLQDKAGMVLRGKIHLATLTPPSVVGDVMAGTGRPKVGLVCPLANNGHLYGAPLNGGSPSTFVETQTGISR